MDLAVITAKQVLQLLLMILAGAACCKWGVFKPSEKSVLANILLYLVVPAMVLDSYMVEFDPATFHNLLLAFLLGALALLVGLAIAFAGTLGTEKSVRPIMWFACAFSNAGYMGFPLIRALFGTEGLLYASGFVTVFNILIWTIGTTVLSGTVQLRQIARNVVTCPCILAVAAGLVIYLCRIPVPEILTGPVGAVGDMNTPLSMIITGATIASSDLKKLLSNPNLFRTLAVRMLLVPAVTLGLFALLGLQGMVPTIVLLLEACPCAAITTMFAIQYRHDEELAAGSVVFSTLGSIVTLPIYALLLTALL
ncbi:AEC family transporter [uncultured Subdoligranulum sp.]|uniref:AEC family transporter n=1 Tax=uncultured Subdoligranulum sp. TaxID=512298 RepID=UPI0025DB70B0|nr:AEC family transporter [uncultured Subdoligranulum sp.]